MLARLMKTALCIAVAVVAVGMGLPSPSAGGVDLEALVAQTGAATWQEREQAQQAIAEGLAEAPEQFGPVVFRAFLRQDDPEVRSRLGEALVAAFNLPLSEVLLKVLAGLNSADERGAGMAFLRGHIGEWVYAKPKGYLGSNITQPSTPEQYEGVEGDLHPIVIARIDTERNCLEAADIVNGDKVLRIGPYWCRRGAFEVSDLIAYVALLSPGDPLALLIRRGDETLTKRVILEERPERLAIRATAEMDALIFEWWVRRTLDRFRSASVGDGGDQRRD